MKKDFKLYLTKLMKKICFYLKTNVIVTVFIVTNLINAFILRLFTVNNIFAIKPILADSVVLLFISSFGYFFKPKKQFRYFLIWSIIFTAVCIINCIYYSNYISFASFPVLSCNAALS